MSDSTFKLSEAGGRGPWPNPGPLHLEKAEAAETRERPADDGVHEESKADSGNSSSTAAFAGGVPSSTHRRMSSCASEPQLWRSYLQRPRQYQPEEQTTTQPEQENKLNERRRDSQASTGKSDDGGFVLREACLQDLPQIRHLMRRHLRSLILPAVFYWLCCHAQDFGSFLAICCCFVPLSRVLMSLMCFLLLLLIRVVLELEQYAAKGCPDLENFETQYLKADRSRFWVAEVSGIES